MKDSDWLLLPTLQSVSGTSRDTDWEERCMVGSGFRTHLPVCHLTKVWEQTTLNLWMCWSGPTRPIQGQAHLPLGLTAAWTEVLSPRGHIFGTGGKSTVGGTNTL